MRIVILGSGFIGKKIYNFFPNSKLISSRINSVDDAIKIINDNNPDVLVNCIGKTGKPNVDWCENNKEETLFSNVIVPSFISLACKNKLIRMVHIGSGCIYEGTNGDNGFDETDSPNFYGSFYSRTKILSESILNEFDVLQVRIRMPIDSKPDERNLITKILKYDKIMDSNNSVTIVEDFLEILKILIEKKETGIFNVTNKGMIKNSDIIKLYERYSKKEKKYEIISEKDLDEITQGRRSNCTLSTKKLESIGIKIPNLEKSLQKTIKDYVKNES